MKKTKLLSILLLGLFVVSCKKSYTFNCVTTEVDSNSNPVYTGIYYNKSVEYSEKMKEKQAKSACDHEQEQLLATYSALSTNNGTQAADPKNSIKVSCTLK